MANQVRISNAQATAAADASTPNYDDGYLRIYDGSQPATVDTAIGAQVLLAELRFAADAFPASTNGVAAAAAITQDASANADGTASWFRCFASDGTTALLDGTVGTSDCDLNLNTVDIVTGGIVALSGFTYTQEKE